MNKSKKVIELIQKAKVFSDRIFSNGAVPADIEIDLLKHYLRYAYEALSDLEPNGSGITEGPVKLGQDENPPVGRKEEKPEEKPQEVQPTTAFEIEEVKPHETENKAEVENSGESEIRNDRFKKDTPLLGEQIADRGDLRKIIDINKRYLYVQELFGGDETLYEKAISDLNKMTDYQRAAKYATEQLENRFNWRDQKKYRDLFYRSLQKRFGVAKSNNDEEF